MLACFECRNLQDFVQVSGSGDARPIRQESSKGIIVKPWSLSDERAPGIYCRKCSKVVDGDPVSLGLLDDRIAFVDPLSFDAAAVADEMMKLRNDAEWRELRIPGSRARYAAVPKGLSADLTGALSRSGRSRLFIHQAQSIQAALEGRNVVQATSAGSGKSLGLTIPVLEALSADPDATGIMIFPLRALANDQMSALGRLNLDGDLATGEPLAEIRMSETSEPIVVGRLDGSTLEHERKAIRDNARLLITTPDSLHLSILRSSMRTYKDGTSWKPLLRGLRFVVLDEIHSYQGVFGSAVGNVLRRLRRMSSYYGSAPQFLTASATIGNPIELATGLTGLDEFELVDDDGSERRPRVLLVCNPPERSTAKHRGGEEAEKGEASLGRLAPQTIAIDLIADAALSASGRDPVRSIVFCQSRTAVFGLTKRIQNALADSHHTDLAERVAPYAATFVSGDREEEEGKLRDGSTLAVVSTSALELGIDIPDLSVAVLVGYPGQISSFRQRIGRVGRKGEGLAVLIVGDDPLQQHLARDPESLTKLLEARAEDVRINPAAPEIARRYGLLPAQEELGGISYFDAQFFGTETVESWLTGTAGAPALEVKGNPYWRVGETEGEERYQPLRNSVAGESYSVVTGSKTDPEEIGVIDGATAPRDAFVPAVWTGPSGRQYIVVGFEKDQHRIFCEGPVELAYNTRGVVVDTVDRRVEHQLPIQCEVGTIGYGELGISRQVHNYKEQYFSGEERSLPTERGWPPVEFITDGLHIEPTGVAFVDEDDRDGAFRAVEHLFLSVAPVLIACDQFDLDASSDRTGIYVYDSFGGGLRLSEPLFYRFDELRTLALEVVGSCDCVSGCPSCIMLSRRPDGNQGLSKAGAISILSAMVVN